MDRVSAIQGAVLVLGGLVMCFRGRAIFKVLLPAMGFVVFGLATMALARPHAGGDTLVIVAMGFLGGAIGAALMMAAYVYGLFMVGAAFGAHLGALVAHRFGTDPGTLVLLAGVLGGMATIAAERALVVIATSVWGAMFSVTGYLMLIGRVAANQLADPAAIFTLGQHALALPVAWGVLAIAGMLLQLRSERRTVVVR